MIDWTSIGPSVLASFMASMVEFVEALTIVLAVGVVRGWRSALLGTAAGLVVLAGLVAILGRSLTGVPLPVLLSGRYLAVDVRAALAAQGYSESCGRAGPA